MAELKMLRFSLGVTRMDKIRNAQAYYGGRMYNRWNGRNTEEDVQ